MEKIQFIGQDNVTTSDLDVFISKLKAALLPDIKREIESSKPRDGDEFIKMKEVCKLLQISKPTLYEWIDKGLIRKYTIESRVYFNQEEILELLRSSTK